MTAHSVPRHQDRERLRHTNTKIVTKNRLTAACTIHCERRKSPQQSVMGIDGIVNEENKKAQIQVKINGERIQLLTNGEPQYYSQQ